MANELLSLGSDINIKIVFVIITNKEKLSKYWLPTNNKDQYLALTKIVTAQKNQIKVLTQEVSMLKKEVNNGK